MKKISNYLKFMGIFLVFELMITFLVSLLSLFGLNSGITSIILLICNIIIFLILNYFNALKIKKRGYLEGLILGSIFLVLMILIKFILFGGGFGISTLIYYMILLFTSILGGMIGVNKKSED